jgi:hypothetical protein
MACDHRLPSSDQQVHEMMVMVDADQDGEISYGDFASFAESRFVGTRLTFSLLLAR